MVLPASGRKGRAPRWPLEGRAPAIWTELWHTPQAVAWEAMGWTRVVARYALLVLAAEKLDKDAQPEARQLEDRLGLTPKAMRLLLWTIEDVEPVSPPTLEVVPDRWRTAAAG